MSDELPYGLIAFGPDANCTLDLCPVEWSVYQYRPSIPANSVFLALFGIAMFIHIYLGIRWRSWGYMVIMMIWSRKPPNEKGLSLRMMRPA